MDTISNESQASYGKQKPDRVLLVFPEDVDTRPFWAFLEALGLDKYIVDEENIMKVEQNEWFENPQVIDSIQRGEVDIANGRAVEMTAKDVRNLLGL